jgi:hypothetical protein
VQGDNTKNSHGTSKSASMVEKSNPPTGEVFITR